MTSRTGTGAAQGRLLALQGVWSHERMHGVGMAWAAEPLLRDLGQSDPQRLAEARIRAAEPFNCHPVLAGLALGASVRAEYDGLPGAQVSRLRTALGGPLGALGDQLFWAGLVPLLVGATLALVAIGYGPAAILVLLVGYNVVRWRVAAWALTAGLRAGTDVGTVLQQSWLPRAASGIGPWAGLAVGLALPLVVRWMAVTRPGTEVLAISVLALGTAALAWRLRAQLPPVRLALGLVALVLLVRLGVG